MQKPLKPGTEAALKKYNDVMLKLLRKEQRRVGPGNPELNPPSLSLSTDARKIWVAFADECERDLAAGKRLEPVGAFGSKLPEQALRIAGVLELVDSHGATEISAGTFKRAVVLARYYASEALRLFEQGSSSIELQRAEKLLKWLHEGWGKATVGLSEIYQLGPNAIRDASRAREAMTILEQHHWVGRIEGGAKIDGKRHRDAWEIVRV